MHHTLALAVSMTNNVETDMVPVPDSIWAIQNAHFMPQIDWFLQAAIFMNVDADRCRIVTPTLRQITTPFLRPVEGNLTPGSRPAVADYTRNPLRLKALEEIQVLGFQNGAGAAIGAVGLFLSPGGLTPMPSGDVFTLRGTSTTAAVANTWQLLSVTWQDTLPAGVYACVGLEHISATAKLARLQFEEQTMRPGSVSMSDTENFTHPMFRMGGLGVWGRFTGNRFPNVEVLCNTTDNAHEVYVDLIKVQ